MVTAKRSWFVFMSTTNWHDYNIANNVLRTMHTKMDADMSVYVLWFGLKSKSSTVPLLLLRAGSVQVLQVYNYLSFDDIISITRHSVSIVVKEQGGVPVDAILGYYHAAGFVCGGQWKRTKHHFMRVTDFCSIIVEPLGSPLVVFDACYMGNMTCLYEMPSCVQYVVASPGFHPYASLLSIRAFFNLPVLHKVSKLRLNTILRDYSASLCQDWMNLAWKRAKYSCLLAFDMRAIAPLANELGRSWHLLEFGEHSRIDKEDSNLSDLYNAAIHAPHIRKLIDATYLHLPYTRKCIKVNGPSVERRMPKKWQEEYRATKIWKHVLQNHW